MKLLSSINLEETNSRKRNISRDEDFEVEAIIGSRTALLYFDVEVVVDYYDNYIDGMFESSITYGRARLALSMIAGILMMTEMLWR